MNPNNEQLIHDLETPFHYWNEYQEVRYKEQIDQLIANHVAAQTQELRESLPQPGERNGMITPKKVRTFRLTDDEWHSLKMHLTWMRTSVPCTSVIPPPESVIHSPNAFPRLPITRPNGKL